MNPYSFRTPLSFRMYISVRVYFFTLITSTVLTFLGILYFCHFATLFGNMAAIPESRYLRYPPRINMSECPLYFGKVSVFVAYTPSIRSEFGVAQNSLDCYLKSTNYTKFMVDLDNDPRVNKSCWMHKSKHCAASIFVKDTDWMLVLDADTGVVNPNHCIEEWIDNRVDILFYERMFNFEIAAGNYLVKNSAWAIKFLQDWAGHEFTQSKKWHAHDQGGLMMNILKSLMPEAVHEQKQCASYWRNATNYATYMASVICVRLALGSKRIWPGKIRLYRRAHAWVRDRWMTYDKWCDQDFMFHGWQEGSISKLDISPFHSDIDPNNCGVGYQGWTWNMSMRKSTREIRELVRLADITYRKTFPSEARVIPFIDAPILAECYPHCESVSPT
ncbi:hypothetical protein Y032_0110g201 [Ancylostoma ceylanicum]|uniref:Nucleotide-diphospho-sugar transferase domain-containing protein n=1 Tax=Ancylostoma ceylanicum TaxID=53326 RepID=A0A016TEM2_9BILA|nr:hypothetical protein Y032_0110g201 [Ancylostoma ceylanicum]